jgi:eukaryotic-like serine/threonine-protein kinase
MLHAFRLGQILLEKYRVERVLGAGGMGVVIAARHLALDELVALKFMLGGGSQADLTRFVREARATVRLRSQHVARVFDVAALEDGTPFMVLEHLDGSDLAQVLRERGPLPVGEAVDAILQACEAIAEAHSIGIVHRDIKPGNLFSTRGTDGSPCIKVLDFGIAKWSSASTEKMDVSQPMGSAPYMAPEQLAATNRVDPRTDVWALGATLFHLLTGKPPFHHDDVDSVQAMMHAVLYRPPMLARAKRADLPEAMESVLHRCLDKDQARRFPSVAALAAALAPFGTDLARVYAKRVARVLGEPEPVTSVIPRSDERATPTSRVEMTAPLSQAERPAGSGVVVVSTSRQAIVALPSKQPRAIAIGIVVALALAGPLVGLQLGRERAVSPTATVPEAAIPPPIENPAPQVEVRPAATATATTSVTTPARSDHTVTAATPARTVTVPRSRKPPAAPSATPSATPSAASSSSKEELHSRRQ